MLLNVGYVTLITSLDVYVIQKYAYIYIYTWYPPWYLPSNFYWYSLGLVTDLHGWSLFIYIYIHTYIYVQREDRKVRNLAKYSENIIYNILDMLFGIFLGVFPQKWLVLLSL